MADEYEIVPEKEVEDLKREVEEIKKNPFGSTPSGREMLRAMKDLTESINHLIGLFRDAADAMKLEEKESEAIGKKLAPMLDKMNMLIDQNEKIARGIVGVADIVKEDISRKSEMPRQSFRPMPSSQPSFEREQFSRPEIAPPSAPPGPMPSARPGSIMPPPSISGGLSSVPPPAAPKEKPKRKLFGF